MQKHSPENPEEMIIFNPYQQYKVQEENHFSEQQPNHQVQQYQFDQAAELSSFPHGSRTQQVRSMVASNRRASEAADSYSSRAHFGGEVQQQALDGQEFPVLNVEDLSTYYPNQMHPNNDFDEGTFQIDYTEQSTCFTKNFQNKDEGGSIFSENAQVVSASSRTKQKQGNHPFDYHLNSFTPTQSLSSEEQADTIIIGGNEPANNFTSNQNYIFETPDISLRRDLHKEQMSSAIGNKKVNGESFLSQKTNNNNNQYMHSQLSQVLSQHYDEVPNNSQISKLRLMAQHQQQSQMDQLDLSDQINQY